MEKHSSTTKAEKKLNSLLIHLLWDLGMSKPRIMLTMAIMTAYKLQMTMAEWTAEYYEKEGTMTTQIFLSKLDELTGQK